MTGTRRLHSVSAAIEKDWSPRFLNVLIAGCWSRIALPDLRERCCCFTSIS